MTQLPLLLKQTPIDNDQPKHTVVKEIRDAIIKSGYEIVELNDQKPWGAYFRLNSDKVNLFLEDFFQGLSLEDARLGHKDAELSPKILLVAPHQRLSWQYHNRRAERWAFLTSGAFNRSHDDEEGELQQASPNDIVQFAQSERHRLIGMADQYVIVAEIWQHSDQSLMSDEDDIVRLQDDYNR